LKNNCGLFSTGGCILITAPSISSAPAISDVIITALINEAELFPAVVFSMTDVGLPGKDKYYNFRLLQNVMNVQECDATGDAI